MANPCKNWLLALCLGVILVFLGQSIFCLAEHAGILKYSTEQSADGGNTANQGTLSHCCHGHSHSAVIFIERTAMPLMDLSSIFHQKLDDFAPDAPVREIEYPPQLS